MTLVEYGLPVVALALLVALVTAARGSSRITLRHGLIVALLAVADLWLLAAAFQPPIGPAPLLAWLLLVANLIAFMVLVRALTGFTLVGRANWFGHQTPFENRRLSRPENRGVEDYRGD